MNFIKAAIFAAVNNLNMIYNSIKRTAVAFILSSVFAVPNISVAQVSDQSKIDYAMQIIKYAYVDSVDEKKLTDEALRAMVKGLDPHSVYISPEELREANEPLVGKFEGVGIQFNIHEDTILVTQTIPGGPSEKLGIKAGDRIVKIDGINVANVKITNNDVLKKLRGDKGTKVTVGIYRRGLSDLIDYTITRDQIPLFCVDAAYQVAPGVGYIKISRFADSAVEEFVKALDALKKQGITSLILDLQGNGGGYLNRAVGLADEFLGDGKKIVYTRGRTSAPEDYNASPLGNWEKGKVAVLIDESSASASEIVSGAIQDWDRGLIIGRRSFGKGLVQKPYQLPDGSVIRLTIAHYYTPSGRNIQKPYQLGDDEEYDLDISNRLKHGELFYQDSIHFDDTTKYFTNNKRLVRGGGGIMPDLFVPLDTSMNTQYYSDLLRKNVLNDFTISYADNHRNELKGKYADVFAFKSGFDIDDKLMNEILAAAEKAGVKMDQAQFKTSEKLIRLVVKAQIARNLWDTNAYFVIINDINNALNKAVQAIQDNTFEKLKIANK
jgi:carboxyl-terminal processing protease